MKNRVGETSSSVTPRGRIRPVLLCPTPKRGLVRLRAGLILGVVLATAGSAGCAWQWRERGVSAPGSKDVLPTRLAKGGEDYYVRRVAQIQQFKAGDGHKYYWCYDDGCKQPSPKTPWTPLGAQPEWNAPSVGQTTRVFPPGTASIAPAAAFEPASVATGGQQYEPPVLPVQSIDVPLRTAPTALPQNAGTATVTSPPAAPVIVYEELSRVVHFRSGKANVNNLALAELNLLMPAIENADFIVLRGLTDSDGTTRTNRRLAITRALVVKDLLVSRGINPFVIAFTEAAGTYLAPNDSSESKSRNRAVELKIRIPRS